MSDGQAFVSAGKDYGWMGGCDGAQKMWLALGPPGGQKPYWAIFVAEQAEIQLEWKDGSEVIGKKESHLVYKCRLVPRDAEKLL